MRPRSVSMYVDKGSALQNEATDDEWLIEDKLKLIGKIKDILPSRDSLRFDERISNIKWQNIIVGSYSSAEIQEQFFNILQNVRKHRILLEIIKDAEKDLISSLDLKKPLSSFALFLQENKEQINEKKSLTNEAYTKTASNIFKSLSENERKVYEIKFQNAKQKYEKELSKFNLIKEIGTKTKNKSSSKSQADTPLLYYWKEKKYCDNTANYNNVRKEYSEMKPKHKLKWVLKFLGVTRGTLLSLEQFEKAITHLNKDELSLIDDYEKRPKKLNAFNMFMKRYLLAAGTTGVNVFKSGVDSWKSLPEAEKLQIKEHSAKLKLQYDTDFKTFLESLPEDRRNYEINKYKKPISKKILPLLNAEKTSTKKIIEVNNKRKRSKKLEIQDDEDDELEAEPVKKIKKSVKNDSETINNHKNNKKSIKVLVKPPGSLYKYFVLQVFKGPRANAKSAFKLLNTKKMKVLTKKYENTKSNYLKEFEEHLVSLSAEQIALFAKEINENGSDDNISDITDSD